MKRLFLLTIFSLFPLVANASNLPPQQFFDQSQPIRGAGGNNLQMVPLNEGLARLSLFQGDQRVKSAELGKPLRIILQEQGGFTSLPTITVLTTSGDKEFPPLTEVEPGLYVAEVTPIRSEAQPLPANDILETQAGDELFVVYEDTTPGDSQAVRKVQAQAKIYFPGTLSVFLPESDQQTYVAPKEGQLLVRVQDLDEDKDNQGGTDSLSVPFTTTRGDKGLLSLKETQIPGRFERLVSLEYGLPDLEDEKIQTGPGDEVIFSFVDFLGHAGGQVVAQATLETAQDAEFFVHKGKQEVFAIPFDETVTLVLTDLDGDSDQLGESDQVLVALETFRGDMEKIVLQETAKPGVFAAPLKVTYGMPLIADQTLGMVGADSVSFFYDDQQNVRPWAPIKRDWVYDGAATAKLSLKFGKGGGAGELQAPGEAVFVLEDKNLDEDGEGETDVVELPIRSFPSGYEEILRFEETKTPGRFEGHLKVGFVPQLSNSMAVEPGEEVVLDYADEVHGLEPGTRNLQAKFRVVDRPEVTVVHEKKQLPLQRLPLGETALVQLGGDGLKYWNGAPDQLTVALSGPGNEKEQLVFKRRADGVYESMIRSAHAQPIPGNGIAETLGDDTLKLDLDYPGMAKNTRITLAPGTDGRITIADANDENKDLPNLNYSGGRLKIQVQDLDQDKDLKGGTDTVVISFNTAAKPPGLLKSKDFQDQESIRLKETDIPGVFEGFVMVKHGAAKNENQILSGLSRTGTRLVYDDSAPLRSETGGLLAWMPYWQGKSRVVMAQETRRVEMDQTGNLKVTILDPDLDKDGKPKSEQVKAKLSVSGQDQESLVLKEGEIPGLFEGQIPYTVGQWFDQDGQFQYLGLENVLVSYTDPLGSEKIIADSPTLLENPADSPQPVGPSDDFFLVALVDLVAGNHKITGMVQALDGQEDMQAGKYEDGRVSLYAIGKIKAHTLLEASYDSKRSRGDDTAISSPSPDAYYPVYGDTSTVDYSAVPQGKLFVKISRKVLDLLLGDYNTAMAAGEFMAYSRQLNGIKAQYSHRKAKVLAFAAKVGHSQAVDRIQGMGTSGPYQLCDLVNNQGNLLIHQDHEFGGKSGEDGLRYNTTCKTNNFLKVVHGGETVTIETRKRDHVEILEKQETLKRYIDYDMDSETGSVTLKRPLLSVDNDRNPLFLVVRYEYQLRDSNKGDQVGGAQIAFNAGKTKITASAVVEDGRLSDRTLAGLMVHQELPWHLGDLEVETGWTDEQSAGRQGYATRAVWHKHGRLDLGLHWLDQDANYSDQHLSFGERATTKLYTSAKYRVTKKLYVSAARSETVTPLGEADENSFGATYTLSRLQVALDRNQVTNNLGESSKSGLNLRYQLTEKLEVEAGKTRFEDEAGTQRDIDQIGLSWAWDDRTQIFVRRVDEGLSEPTTFAGVTSTFQESRNRRSYLSYQLLSGASGVRNAMLVGTQQRWRLNDKMGANASFEQGLARDTSGAAQDTRSMTAGLEWSPTTELKASVRAERKENGIETTDALYFAGSGQFSKDTTVFARYDTSTIDRRNIDRSDLLFGLAYRSSKTQTLSGLLSFRRRMETVGLFERVAQVINAEVGANLDPGLNVTLRYSLKDSDFLFNDGIGVRTRSNLWLARVNKRISSRWDAQADYSMLQQRETHTRLRNYGSELGYILPRTMDSTRLAVGYHWLQFRDEDYAIRAVNAEGPYFRFNVKY